VFGFVDVKDVDDRFETAENVVVSTHVRGQDTANNVLTQAPVLLQGEVVERIRHMILQTAERVRAVVVLQGRYVVVTVCQRRTSTDLHRASQPDIVETECSKENITRANKVIWQKTTSLGSCRYLLSRHVMPLSRI